MLESIPTGDQVLLAREEGRLGPLIEEVLAELVGLRWEDLNRAADMVTLGFGEVVTQPPLPPMPTMRAELRERLQRSNEEPIARSRLHVQCPLRIDGPAGPFVGAQDVYRAADAPHGWLEEDDRGTLGASLFDRRAADFDAGVADERFVTSVSGDSGGGFVLVLSGGWCITVAPSSAAVREFWRYFHADGGGHFVLFDDD